MKKQKISALLFIAIFTGICAVPGIFTPFFPADISSENRTETPAPVLYTNEKGLNTNWGNEAESYFAERFAFRSQFVTTNAFLRSNLLQVSSSSQVVLGKEHFLYYEETMPDYLGTNRLSEHAVQNICQTLSLIQTYVEEQGGTFLFTISPNKNTVYPEYMPKRYLHTTQATNLERIAATLPEYHVSYCDLVSVLKDGKTKAQTYHNWDSHWNQYGATLVYDALLTACDISHPDYIDAPYTWESVWDGDLYPMLYPNGTKKDLQAVYDIPRTFTYGVGYEGVDDINITLTNETQTGSLFLFRDSFGRSLLPLMGEAFATTRLSRGIPYAIQRMETGDTVILEIVERNLTNLCYQAPYMPAPTCDPITPNARYTGNNTTVYYEKSGSMLHMYGTLDPAIFLSDTAEIYAIFHNADGTELTYQAFPCLDIPEEQRSELTDNGFALYLPLEQIENNMETKLIVVSGERRIEIPLQSVQVSSS